jgi:hypothetical protein
MSSFFFTYPDRRRQGNTDQDLAVTYKTVESSAEKP